jgi:hypothetical protein
VARPRGDQKSEEEEGERDLKTDCAGDVEGLFGADEL